MNICIVVGTRPEIIKMSPIIRYCELKKLNYIIIHTGQHYSINMDKIFFEELELPQPKYNLDVGSGTHGKQTGLILEKIEQILLKETPDIVLVEGDTNTVLAGALAAAKLHIKVGHVEAGLRSYDRHMPEELNRILTDHLSDFLFAPTENAKNIALKEGIDEKKIFVTGNTIVDAVYQNLKLAKTKSNILNGKGIKKNEYILITAHRQENVDIKSKLKNMLEGFGDIGREIGIKMIYPIHPRTRKMIAKFKLNVPECIELIEPVGFMDFLMLEANAKAVLTDSGGVQEESCILKVPCVTLRENTERPETIEVGSNMLAGADPKKMLKCLKLMLKKKRSWKNPFGDGKAAEKIMELIENENK